MFERLLSEITKVAQQSLDMETMSARDGALQRLDPRFVFLLLISLVVVTVLLHSPMSILLMIGLSTGLALMSNIPLKWLFKRVWLFVPLFTVVILIPAMTSLITPGHQVGPALEVFGTTFYLTREGLAFAMTFTLRVGAAVTFSVLMVATIGWSRLMRTMAQLRLPPAFVVTMDMTYRYIHVLLDMVANMFIARKSRMVGKPTSKELRNIGSSVVASLFSKSYQMSENVYMAMVSRGYTGRPRMMAEFRSGRIDKVFAMVIVGFMAIVTCFDLLVPNNLHGLLSIIGM
ncbi:MAG: cobalt ECF transporter T component CbiQ [Methanomassiliicoccus sp.]|nr:cobalt ECF transporter T component CbiQ [Methanomassiliicoccus sp.]